MQPVCKPRKILADDRTLASGKVGRASGAEAEHRDVAASFPDLQSNVAAAIAEGVPVVVRDGIRRIRQRGYLWIPASQEQLSYLSICIRPVEDGKVAYPWGEGDRPSLPVQLGGIQLSTEL